MSWISVALYALLLAGWATAAANTARDAARGRIFLPAGTPPPQAAAAA